MFIEILTLLYVVFCGYVDISNDMIHNLILITVFYHRGILLQRFATLIVVCNLPDCNCSLLWYQS